MKNCTCFAPDKDKPCECQLATEDEVRVDALVMPQKSKQKHPKCLGWYDEHNGDFDCDYGSDLTCEDCKYGVGRKDPAAKCNAA